MVFQRPYGNDAARKVPTFNFPSSKPSMESSTPTMMEYLTTTFKDITTASVPVDESASQATVATSITDKIEEMLNTTIADIVGLGTNITENTMSNNTNMITLTENTMSNNTNMIDLMENSNSSTMVEVMQDGGLSINPIENATDLINNDVISTSTLSDLITTTAESAVDVITSTTEAVVSFTTEVVKKIPSVHNNDDHYQPDHHIEPQQSQSFIHVILIVLAVLLFIIVILLLIYIRYKKKRDLTTHNCYQVTSRDQMSSSSIIKQQKQEEKDVPNQFHMQYQC